MDRVSELIERVQRETPDAQVAASELVAIGLPTVPAIVSAMRQSDLGEATNLKRVLLQNDDPAIVPMMIDLLDEEHNALRLTAFQVLGRSGSEEAYQTLIDRLLDKERTESDRAWAADALGEFNDQRAVRELLQTLGEIANEGPLQYYADVALPIVIALAKLGDQTAASYAVELARADDVVVRVRAVKALKYVVAPGLFSVLQVALQDSVAEVCKDAMDALFYLGIKEAVNEFIMPLESEDSDISSMAFFRIYDLTGKLFDDDVEACEVRAWWNEHQSNFETGVCYRLGKPIWLPDIISLMVEEPTWRNVFIEELRIITGHAFGLNPFIHLAYQDLEPVFERARIWWASEGDHFERGALYKYGHKQDITCVMND